MTRPARRRLPSLVTVAVLAVGAACSGGESGSPPTTAPTGGGPGTGAPAGSVPTGGGPELGPFTEVVGGLEVPWGVVAVPGDPGRWLVTERPGRVRVVENGKLRNQAVARFPVQNNGEGGLLGIALPPDFPENRLAYVMYTAADGNRVVRAPVDEDLTFGPEEVLLQGLPSSPTHDGGGVAFGPDGMLYVTTGDAREPSRAADLSSPAGKVLRLRPDGSIPDDNPFPDSPVWSYGHRNPQALGWDSAGNLYVSEHGPSGEFGMCCHDEVNLVRKGQFYGWPFRAGRTPTGQGDPPVEPVDPVVESGNDTWAPNGVAVRSRGDGVDVLVSTLRGTALRRFHVTERPDNVVSQDQLLDGRGRLRVATVLPDGCVVVGTSNRDGRGQARDGDDRLLRACPA
jgi:glucose/arabinose dehydrogenase